MTFDYLTKADEADGEDEQLEDQDQRVDNYNNICSSSPTPHAGISVLQLERDRAESLEAPTFPGWHARDTLDTYINDLSDNEDPPADESPPGVVAMVNETATISTSIERSTTPSDPNATTGTRPSNNGHKARGQPRSSSDSGEYETINLRDYDRAGREDLYARSYNEGTIPLNDFKIPNACDEFPEFAEEILAAYVKHTTFTVKVWANYDSYTKKWYRQPSRLETCGKLQLSARSRQCLEHQVRGLQFSRIQLQIGNPFRTLFNVNLHVVDGQLQVNGVEVRKDVHAPHSMLRWVVRDAIGRIEGDGIIQGRFALSMEDLNNIAKEFVYKPKHRMDLWNHFVN